MSARAGRKTALSEKIVLEKARRQLLIVGVVCVSAIVAALWLTHLKDQFVYHRKLYPSERELFSRSKTDLGDSWRQFQEQVETLRP